MALRKEGNYKHPLMWVSGAGTRPNIVFILSQAGENEVRGRLKKSLNSHGLPHALSPCEPPRTTRHCSQRKPGDFGRLLRLDKSGKLEYIIPSRSLTANRARRPAMTHCPSCGRYVGPHEACPYCGAPLTGRTSIRGVKIVAILLATVGLAALWFAATRAEVPLIQIGQAGATMPRGPSHRPPSQAPPDAPA